MSTSATAPAGERHWSLFADWCSAVERSALPASAQTVVAFIEELPAGTATALRRVRAIDAAHMAAGLAPPSLSPLFDGLLRPPRPPRFDAELVATALGTTLIGGWPSGIVGRRDAAIVALVCTAGTTRRQIRALTTGAWEPSQVEGETASVGEWTVPVMATTEDPGSCPACALSRWRRVTEMIEVAGWRAVRNDLADVGEVAARAETDHDCRRPIDAPLVDERSALPAAEAPARHGTARRGGDGRTPMFCAIDRRGTPQSAYALSIRSITTIVTGRLADALRVTQEPVVPVSEYPRRADTRTWSSDDRARVLAERRAATERLASFESDLDEAEAYADAVLQRLEEQLGGGGYRRSLDGEDRDSYPRESEDDEDGWAGDR